MAEARCLSRLKALVEPGFHGKLTHYLQHVLLKQYTPLGCYLWSPHAYTILWILTFSLHYFSSSSLPLPTSPPTPSQLLGLMIVFQFYYMAKGLDTMVQDSPREEVTVSDGLQLGRSIADQTDTRNGENEGNDQTGEVCASITTVPWGLTLSFLSFCKLWGTYFLWFQN